MCISSKRGDSDGVAPGARGVDLRGEVALPEGRRTGEPGRRAVRGRREELLRGREHVEAVAENTDQHHPAPPHARPGTRRARERAGRGGQRGEGGEPELAAAAGVFVTTQVPVAPGLRNQRESVRRRAAEGGAEPGKNADRAGLQRHVPITGEQRHEAVAKPRPADVGGVRGHAENVRGPGGGARQNGRNKNTDHARGADCGGRRGRSGNNYRRRATTEEGRNDKMGRRDSNWEDVWGIDES
mmetsp:Transcript_20844/g.52594  ORF Transcript_20844/g.52594 Transcript_20844/m.52594 type:complete len:242 (+) Transcript_20844:1095-1820(+)